MKKTTALAGAKSGNPGAEAETLAATLEGVAGLIRSGACHLNGDKMTSLLAFVLAQVQHDGPAGLLTTYQVCERLNGITSRTLYNWVDAGVFPRPFQLPGAGNTRFWYSDDVEAARKDLIAKKYI